MENTDAKWYLVNVVWYDGSEAFVSKFILRAEIVRLADKDFYEAQITHDSQRRARKYLDGSGEILKFDPLYSLTFDNIMAFANDERHEYSTAFGRFKEMWF